MLFRADLAKLCVVATNIYIMSIWHDFVKNGNGLKNILEMSGCKNITFPICGTTQILTGPEDPCCHFVAR